MEKKSRFRIPFFKQLISCLILTIVPLIGADAFDLSNPIISLDEIHSGGPEKDGIPALTDPVFMEADDADFLLPHDRVMGVIIGGEAKAYPLKILNWHELVNDRVGEQDILVTYCPLCGSGMVFDATVNGKRSFFGVSGLLYNSDVLFYDLATESLWSQLAMKAVTGAHVGTRLQHLPAQVTTWRDWLKRFPDTKALSPDTGYERAYETDPYFIYSMTSDMHFPNLDKDRRLDAKQWVYGVIVNDQAKAYPLSELVRSKLPIQDLVGGISIEIDYNRIDKTVRIENSEGSVIPGVQCYWFAWSSFYPETLLYQRAD